ncbi:glutathione S-transferase [Macrolepiota fuliginosa MF-IS2]|uniref:glutathione transferase n=1 Tax=Macrolepiota fuliginosa MF-IS2 TaxID=1400762 RepID=A0A9P6C1M2_9AGAR|nr:glutathione S-transferase [Macrolepiota fuliginosa MF-IS2]
MVLKLYGSYLSTCTRRVGVVLHEKKIPFEFHNIDLAKGEHKSSDFIAKQPFGQVPYIDDDGFILFESRAITRYLEDKYSNQGTKLIPADRQKRALFEQAASIEQANFDSYAAPLVFEVVFKARRGLQTDPAKVKEYTEKLADKLKAYDQILAKQKYLAGDEVTLADLFHLPYGSMLPAAGVNLLQELPNVSRWFNDITSRPAWGAVKDGVKSTA